MASEDHYTPSWLSKIVLPVETPAAGEDVHGVESRHLLEDGGRPEAESLIQLVNEEIEDVLLRHHVIQGLSELVDAAQVL